MPAVLKGDGLMTNEPGVLLGIQTADCIPVLVAARKERAVAAFHAGWRGTLARIVENGVGRMRLEFGSNQRTSSPLSARASGSAATRSGKSAAAIRVPVHLCRELFREVYDSDPIRQKYPMLFLSARAPGHSDIGPSMHLDLAEANNGNCSPPDSGREQFSSPAVHRLPHGSFSSPTAPNGDSPDA